MITTRERIIATAAFLLLLLFVMGAAFGNGLLGLLCAAGAIVILVSIAIYIFWI